MSTRERWIVYPLLFFALGTAVKPKLVPPEVTCRRLIVLDDDRRTRLQLGVSGSTFEPYIQLKAANGLPLATIRSDPETHAGRIETRDSTGALQTELSSGKSAGELIICDNLQKNAIGISHRDGRFQLVDIDLKTGNYALLPIELRPHSK